jgi:hypothetical protein
MTKREKVLDQIKKLRALSEKAGTEHEAAAAAAMAARMMLQHRIAEAEVDAEDGEAEEQPIVREYVDESFKASGIREGGYGKKMPRWRADLLHGVALSLSCTSIYLGRRMSVIGPEEAVQTAIYLYRYLWREIWRLAVERGDAAFDSGDCGKRAWTNAFRLGATAVVIRRLKEERRTVIDEAEERARKETAARTTALVLRTDAQRSAAALDELYPGHTKMNGARISDGSGYSAGVRAGGEINLRGGPGLKAPATKLPRR